MGQGAIDMKGHAVAHLMALIAIKRSGIPLTRDLVFIANSDEELLGGKGAKLFVQRHADLLKDVEYLITEGSTNRVEAGRVVHYSVSVAEKLNYSHRITFRGTPSHGSRPNEANPILPLVEALNDVARFESPLRVTQTVEQYFRDIASMYSGEQRAWLSDVRLALANEQARAWILLDPTWHAYLRNTAQITVLKGSGKTNVIPPEASAELDIRLLPGTSPDDFVSELRRAVKGSTAAEWTRIFPVKPGLSSPTNTALYRTIQQIAHARDPGAIVTTPLVPGGTDLPWYRQLGIVAYGVDPFRIERTEVQRGLHGNDERIGTGVLADGVRFMYELVKAMQ